jgi:hypothetical protein
VASRPRAPARTHTYPVSRTHSQPARVSYAGKPGPTPARQHRKLPYTHSSLCEHDITVVAAVFGITETELLATACRLYTNQQRDAAAG